MKCQRCGTENDPGARFCSSCGATLMTDEGTPATDAPRPDPTEETTPPPDATPAPTAPMGSGPGGIGTEARGRLRTGWGTAIRWAFVPFVSAFALSLLLSVLAQGAQPFQFAPTPPEFAVETSPLDVVTSGLAGAYGYHHASFTVTLPSFDIPDAPFPPGFEFSAAGSFAPMLGTALVAFLLALGGRAVARAAPAGPWWGRIAEGAKIAVPYSILAFAVSFAARQSFELPAVPDSPFAQGGAITFAISPLSAFLWPLLLALVFGAVGGAWSNRDEVFDVGWRTRARAALAGGWRMTWVALALSFVGLLVLAAVHNEGTRTYFEIAGQLGGTGGVWFVLTTIVALPNMATWVTVGALGGSTMSVSFFGSSCALVSYFGFPAGAGDAPDLGGGPEALLADPCAALPIRFDTAPLGYFLFLLVPIVAVLLGGMAAARRSPAGATTGERAAAGAGAGLVFALSILGLAIFSDIAVNLDVPFLELFGGGGFGLGPGLLSGFGLAALWGVVGGAAGALIGGRRDRSAPAATPPEERSATA